MPRATVSTDTERFELKTLEGAYVVVRKLAYGETLRRRGLLMAMRTQDANQPNQSKNGNEAESSPVVNFNFDIVQLFDFSTCIVEHNLEDENDRLLNFNKPDSLLKLDPVIGQEVEQIIDKYNGGMSREEEKFLPEGSENDSEGTDGTS